MIRMRGAFAPMLQGRMEPMPGSKGTMPPVHGASNWGQSWKSDSLRESDAPRDPGSFRTRFQVVNSFGENQQKSDRFLDQATKTRRLSSEPPTVLIIG